MKRLGMYQSRFVFFLRGIGLKSAYLFYTDCQKKLLKAVQLSEQGVVLRKNADEPTCKHGDDLQRANRLNAADNRC